MIVPNLQTSKLRQRGEIISYMSDVISSELDFDPT